MVFGERVLSELGTKIKGNVSRQLSVILHVDHRIAEIVGIPSYQLTATWQADIVILFVFIIVYTA